MASSAADDFARLVARANPAASRGQYNQPGNAASATDYAMDPFFEDEDDGGTPQPSYPVSMRTTGTLMDSVPDLPLTANAVPPAGTRPGASSEGLPQGWDFTDDVEAIAPPGAAKSTPSASAAPYKAPKRKWKWPWAKKEAPEGEREIWLNDAPRNDAQNFVTNYVSTSKYNVVTFIPKFFAGMHLIIRPRRAIIAHQVYL